MSEFDTSFLDAEYWTKQGIDKPQLIEMFRAEYERVKKDNPELPQDEIEINAQEDLKSTIASYKKGGASMGKGASFGVTGLFDYVRMWKLSQIKAYQDLVDGKKNFVVLYFKDADGKKTKKTYKTAAEMISDKVVKVIVDPKTGEKKIVALDKRGGDKRGKMYPESSNLSTVIAVWVSSLTKKRYIVEATVGGEQGDSIVNPKCAECGKDSFEKKCKNTINVIENGHKIRRECGADREGYEVPNILDACGTVSSFALKMRTNDKKELIGIEWAQNQTKIIPGKKLEIKMEYERKDGKIVKNPQGQPKKLYSGELMNWIPQEMTINTKLVNEIWVKNKTMTGAEAVRFWNKYGGHAVFLIGTLFDVGKVYYGNRRGSIIDDTTSAEGNDGQPIKIPDHVFYRQMNNKFGKKSLCIFVGKLDREQNKDFKTKKYQTAKIKRKAKDGTITEEEVPVYAKPYINISCIIPIKPQITDEEKVKPKAALEMADDEEKKIVVKEDDVSEDEAAASVKKMAETTGSTEETTEETVEETEEAQPGESAGEEGSAESDDTEPESETDGETEEDADEPEPETKTPATKEDAAEAPEEVETLEDVDKVEKKTKKKRDYGKTE